MTALTYLAQYREPFLHGFCLTKPTKKTKRKLVKFVNVKNLNKTTEKKIS